MATRTQVEEIYSVDFEKFNAWKISEGLAYSVVFVVDDERSSTHCVTSISHFALKNETTNLSINKSINDQINQSINQAINQSMNNLRN